MSKGDLLVERGAAKLQQLARKAAGRGDGVGEWLSEELRADAEFLRKLKPSLIAARARGETRRSPWSPVPKSRSANREPVPTGPVPTATRLCGPTAAAFATASASRGEGEEEKTGARAKSGGPSPILIVGAALVAGIVAAKVIDWRGHAHPRD